MISYAQNFEDVMLWRALKDVKDGFYIDVGANDPVEHSVTKWFYDQGWSGVNIEPNKGFYNKLLADRERDNNLNIGAGKQTGELTFYSFNDTGLSTTDKRIAERHAQNGFCLEEEIIKITTLTAICDEFVQDKTIHFLKVDVEGGEENVLAGMNFIKYRPWIVVVEATEPLSEKKNISWEHILLENGYVNVYFDGLNKFYVANEKKELRKSFISPPNPFDEYVLYEVVKRDYEIASKKQENEAIRVENEAIKTKIKDIEHSISWKITKPLRWLKNIIIDFNLDKN